jgi:hypothetical protein
MKVGHFETVIRKFRRKDSRRFDPESSNALCHGNGDSKVGRTVIGFERGEIFPAEMVTSSE